MRIRFRSAYIGLVLIALAVAALAAALGSALGATTSGARLKVRATHYGKAVFGPSGKVLYVFSADSRKSHCYGACASAWPPLVTRGKPIAGPGVRATLLGTTRRRNGKLQVTYNGHPLYYYVGDTPTAILCQHVNEHGGLWVIIKPNGRRNLSTG